MVENNTARLFMMFDELVDREFYWSAATLWHEMLLRLWGQRFALRDLSLEEQLSFEAHGLEPAVASTYCLANTLSRMWGIARDRRDAGGPDLYEEIMTIAGMELAQVRTRGDSENYCLLKEIMMDVCQDDDGDLINEALSRAET